MIITIVVITLLTIQVTADDEENPMKLARLHAINHDVNGLVIVGIINKSLEYTISHNIYDYVKILQDLEEQVMHHTSNQKAPFVVLRFCRCGKAKSLIHLRSLIVAADSCDSTTSNFIKQYLDLR